MWGKSFRSNWLLQYHGWSDQLISPRNSINYYKSVLDTMGGASKVDESYRLFMVPGMAHCSGGDGPVKTDPLGPERRASFLLRLKSGLRPLLAT
jgi:hypothetical protein